METYDFISYQIRKAEEELLARKANGWDSVSLNSYAAGVVNTLDDMINNPYAELTQAEITALDERVEMLLDSLKDKEEN